MLRLAASGKPIRVVEDHWASPTFAPLLASRTIDLADRNQSGVFHVGGGTPISWFQFARLIFEAANVSPMLLATNEREYRTAARRPRYSALSNAKMERVGLEPMPALPEVLKMYFAQRSPAA
jgi:dTDP-4-dehydrorhamnose reductase